MTPNSFQNLNSSLHALPVAMVFTSKMLLTQKTSAPADNPISDDKPPGSFNVRATKLTAILKGIPGYSHDGLNE